jgi:Fe-S-cluster-containing hydrogenase component 2
MACNQVNHLPEPKTRFDDQSVLNTKRRPSTRPTPSSTATPPASWTPRASPSRASSRIQCMHCQDPACVSACITGALSKLENGTVRYDVSRCIGCRYCMVACPSRYRRTITTTRSRPRSGNAPSVSTGWNRESPRLRLDLSHGSHHLRTARHASRRGPQAHRGIPGTVRGQHLRRARGGGTSWLYIAGQPFDRLGFWTSPIRRCRNAPSPSNMPCSAICGRGRAVRRPMA